MKAAVYIVISPHMEQALHGIEGSYDMQQLIVHYSPRQGAIGKTFAARLGDRNAWVHGRKDLQDNVQPAVVMWVFCKGSQTSSSWMLITVVGRA